MSMPMDTREHIDRMRATWIRQWAEIW